MANSHTTSFTARRVAQQPSGSVFNWPGSSLLAAPLQKAWGDGKITKTEARQLARVILEIRKEAAKREAEEAFVRAAETASEAAHTFDLTSPSLPTIPFSTRVKSHTKRGAFYEVNLSGPNLHVPRFPLICVSGLRAT